MKLITRKRSETTVEPLARRAYNVSVDTEGPASAALVAANAIDIPGSAVGTPLLVPEVPGRTTRDAAEGPARFAADQALALRRALAELRASRERDAAAEVARQSELRRFIGAGGLATLPADFSPPKFNDYPGNLVAATNGRLANVEPNVISFDRSLEALDAALADRARSLDESPARVLRLRRFTLTGPAANRPETRLVVPEGFKILGGGARVEAPNNLLVASFPEDPRTWVARSRDHTVASVAAITVVVVALHDPNDEYEVRLFAVDSTKLAHPSIVTEVGEGFVMTGGGARVNIETDGNFLTASFPGDHRTWVAASKDHARPGPATITSFAIGLRSRRGDLLRTVLRAHTGLRDTQPGASVRLPDDVVLVGGGAQDHFDEPGNMLNRSIAGEGNIWLAGGQELSFTAAARVTAHAIGLLGAVLEDEPPPPVVPGDPPTDPPQDD